MLKLSSFTEIRRVKGCPSRDLLIAAIRPGYLVKNSLEWPCVTLCQAVLELCRATMA